MIKKRFLFLMILFLFVVAGCSEKEQLSENANIAKSYLQEKGYEVISLVSDTNVVLTQEFLETIPGKQEWLVQPIKPDGYIGKSIDRVMFRVKNHPLNKIYEGEIRVIVLLYQDEIIGGTSFAAGNDGGVHYLDGEQE